jgi:hypothetical protein
VVCAFVGALHNDFETFLEKFNAIFWDLDKEHTSTTKFWTFCQRPHLTIMYAFKFKGLTFDILLDENALMN